MANITSDQKLQFKIFNTGATGWEGWAISGATGQIGFNEGTNKIKVNGIEYGLSPTETQQLAAAVETLQNNGLLDNTGTGVTWLEYPAGMTGAGSTLTGVASIGDILSGLKTYTDWAIGEAASAAKAEYKTAIYSVNLTGISGSNLFNPNTGNNFSGITGHIDGADIAVGTGVSSTHTYATTSVASAIEDIDARIKSLDADSDISLWHNGEEITGGTVKADGSTYILAQGTGASTGIVAQFNIVKDSFLNNAKLMWSTSDTEPNASNTQNNRDETHVYPTLYLDMIERDGSTTDDTATDIYIPVTALFHDSIGATGAQINVSVTSAPSGAGNIISATLNDYSIATSHLSTSAYNELTNDVHSIAITGANVKQGNIDVAEGSAVTGVVSVTINGATVKTTTEITGATSIASGTTIEGALQAIDTKLKDVEDAQTGSVVDWGSVVGAATHSKSDTQTGVVLNIEVAGTSVAVATGPTSGGVIGSTSSVTATYDSSSSVAQAIDAVNHGAKQYADSLITWEVVSQ